jgi:enoyl-CoA hydratase
MPTVNLEQSGSIATVTLCRPAALNALTPSMLWRLDEIVRQLATDDSVTVVILTGSGRAFSAGVDLKALGDLDLVDGAVGPILDDPARSVIEAITQMPKPVLAAVNGFCFAGALELALACDLIIVADEAQLGDTHAKWGIRPSWGLSQRLIRAVGPSRARELSYTARTFSGQEAAAWGLAMLSVPLADFDRASTDLAQTIASHSSGAVAAYKDLYRHALDLGLAAGLQYEADTNYPISDTAGRLAAFR